MPQLLRAVAAALAVVALASGLSSEGAAALDHVGSGIADMPAAAQRQPSSVAADSPAPASGGGVGQQLAAAAEVQDDSVRCRLSGICEGQQSACSTAPELPPGQGAAAFALGAGREVRQPEADRLACVTSDTARAAAVQEAARHAWRGYRECAWGKDELQPLSCTGVHWLNLSLTMVDSLDTLYLLGMRQEFEEAASWLAANLDVGAPAEVNLFETTIRILGGLLSAQALSAASHPVLSQQLAEKAAELGARLMPAFDSPSGVPFSDVNLRTGNTSMPDWGELSSLSEISSVSLEFTYLARITGHAAFESVPLAVHERLTKAAGDSGGLLGQFFNPLTGQAHAKHGHTITLGARSDSYYEYLLKQWLLTGKSEDWMRERYVQAMQSVRSRLLKRTAPTGRPGLWYVAEQMKGGQLSGKMDHLVCFLPGLLALGDYHGVSTQPADSPHSAPSTQPDASGGAVKSQPDASASAASTQPEASHIALSAAVGQPASLQPACASGAVPVQEQKQQQASSSDSPAAVAAADGQEEHVTAGSPQQQPSGEEQATEQQQQQPGTGHEQQEGAQPSKWRLRRRQQQQQQQPAEGWDMPDLQLAAELALSCYELYRRSPAGLAPEIAHFANKTELQDFPNRHVHDVGHGDFSIKHKDAHNLLRPESVESFYLLWKVTGDPQYKQWAWQVFRALQQWARVRPEDTYQGMSCQADLKAEQAAAVEAASEAAADEALQAAQQHASGGGDGGGSQEAGSEAAAMAVRREMLQQEQQEGQQQQEDEYEDEQGQQQQDSSSGEGHSSCGSTGGGYTSLESVLLVPPPRRDKMESFFLAETLKYLYLIFVEPPDRCLHPSCQQQPQGEQRPLSPDNGGSSSGGSRQQLSGGSSSGIKEQQQQQLQQRRPLLPLDHFVFTTEAHAMPVVGPAAASRVRSRLPADSPLLRPFGAAGPAGGGSSSSGSSGSSTSEEQQPASKGSSSSTGMHGVAGIAGSLMQGDVKSVRAALAEIVRQLEQDGIFVGSEGSSGDGGGGAAAEEASSSMADGSPAAAAAVGDTADTTPAAAAAADGNAAVAASAAENAAEL